MKQVIACCLLSTEKLFPFVFILLAITCLLLSLVSDASVLRNFPSENEFSFRYVVLPILLTFLEVAVPLILAVNLYVQTSRVPLSGIIAGFLLLAFYWLLAFLLDTYFSFSVYPLTTSVCGLVWIGVGLRLMRRLGLRPRLNLLALCLFLILGVKHIDWNSRRPFIRDLLKIEYGMTADQVDKIMNRYSTGPRYSSEGKDVLLFMHKVPGPFYADAAKVTLKDDQVESVELSFD